MTRSTGPKQISNLGKTYPYKDCGYMGLWAGNLLFGYPAIVLTRTEIYREIFSSKEHVNRSSIYVLGEYPFGAGLANG